MLDPLRFEWPWAATALLLPLAVAVLLPPAEAIRERALRVPFMRLLGLADGAMSGNRSRSRLLTAVVIWLLLVVAACRPLWLGAAVALPVSGRDLMLAVDLSASMDKSDMAYESGNRERLAIVKQVAKDFIARRIGDRIGLILFGSKAYLQVPLTFDRATVQMLLQEANTTLAGPSTAIGDAIGLAIKRLQQQPAPDQVLILLTDGASNAGVNPLQAAGRARQAGIRIYPIGVGSLASQRDSSLDEASLINIAQITQGKYFRAIDGRSLQTIYQLLDELEPAVAEDALLRARKELFHWPLGLAVVWLLLLLSPQCLRHYGLLR